MSPASSRRKCVGGDAIHGGGYRCSAAFNVSKGTAHYFVTAGHCTNAATSWSTTSDGAAIGTSEGTSFPTNDYGIVRYTDGSQPAGDVNLYNGSYQDITSAADAIVGQAIRKSGSTSKVTSGTVTAVNVTVNYGEGAGLQHGPHHRLLGRPATAAARISRAPPRWASTRAAPAAPARGLGDPPAGEGSAQRVRRERVLRAGHAAGVPTTWARPPCCSAAGPRTGRARVRRALSQHW